MSFADAKAALIALLAADTDVAALAADRIYGDEEGIREVVGETIPKTITIIRSGEVHGPGTLSYAPLERGRFDIKCFGESRYEASKLYAAVKAVLRGLVPVTVALDGGSVRLYNAIKSGGPVDMTDPDAQWSLVWSSWGLLSDERVVGESDGMFSSMFSEVFA